MLPLQELSSSDWRFQRWKEKSLYLADLYEKTEDYQYLATRIRSCASYLRFRTVEGKLKLYRANFCRSRFCPICSWRRRLKWINRLKSALNILNSSGDYIFLFLTLSQRNCSLGSLSEIIRKMSLAWRKLSGVSQFKNGKLSKYWPAIGSIRSLEVTRRVLPSGFSDCHPHYHALLICDPFYGVDNYIPHHTGDINNPGWVDLWQSAMGLDYPPTAHVQQVRDPHKACIQVLKYCFKPQDILSPNVLTVIDEDKNILYLEGLTHQLKRIRSIESFGLLRNYLRASSQDDSNLINVSEDSQLSNSEGVDLLFEWGENLLEDKFFYPQSHLYNLQSL